MSESSSEQGTNSKKRTVAQLVDRLRDKTSTERLSLMAHLSVGRTLCRLRDAIANGEEVSKKAAMALLCCGISLYRRHTLADREEEDEALDLLRREGQLEHAVHVGRVTHEEGDRHGEGLPRGGCGFGLG